jgi:DNA-binding response OmpR family regulator
VRLLIIDDDPQPRHLMRRTLEGVGYDIDAVADGRTGLDLFGDGAGYAVTIVEQQLPRLNGLDVVRQIKAQAPDAAVLMVASFASVERIVDALRLGAIDFLRKPLTAATIRSAVAATIAGKRAGSVLAEGDPPAIPLPERNDFGHITVNGFKLVANPAQLVARDPMDHQFRVKHFPEGAESSITVTVHADAVDRVKRLTRRVFKPESAYWRVQAERFLFAHLWSEGTVPQIGRLTMREMSREGVEAAATWDQE